jgi:hypothetical protein
MIEGQLQVSDRHSTQPQAVQHERCKRAQARREDGGHVDLGVLQHGDGLLHELARVPPAESDLLMLKSPSVLLDGVRELIGLDVPVVDNDRRQGRPSGLEPGQHDADVPLRQPVEHALEILADASFLVEAGLRHVPRLEDKTMQAWLPPHVLLREDVDAVLIVACIAGAAGPLHEEGRYDDLVAARLQEPGDEGAEILAIVWGLAALFSLVQRADVQLEVGFHGDSPCPDSRASASWSKRERCHRAPTGS